jgi:magnesium-transporting ATPase (P-type)
MVIASFLLLVCSTFQCVIPCANRKPNWFTRNRHLVQGPTLRRFVLSDIICQAALCAGIARQGYWDLHCVEDDNYSFFLIQFSLQMLWSSLLSSILMVLAWMLRRHHSDGFGVKDELKLLGAAISAIIVSVIIIAVVTREWKSYILILDWIFCPMLATLVVVIVLCRPIYLTYRWQKRIDQIGNIGNLSELLTIQGAFAAFLSFCATEFSSENLVRSALSAFPL